MAKETHHQYCAANVSMLLGDPRPLNATLVLLSPTSSDTKAMKCRCGNLEHCDDVERSKGRKNTFVQRAAAFASMSVFVADTIADQALSSNVLPRSHGTRLKLRPNSNPIHDQIINFSTGDEEETMCYPTESAERATLRKKELKAAGETPNRTKTIVEDHHDDLGDDLSGLGGDLQYLSAEVTHNNWSDSEDDVITDEATTIMTTRKPPIRFQETTALTLWSQRLAASKLRVLEIAASHINANFQVKAGGVVSVTAPFY